MQKPDEARRWARQSCGQAVAIARLPDSMPFETPPLAHLSQSQQPDCFTSQQGCLLPTSLMFPRNVGQAHVHPKHLTR